MGVGQDHAIAGHNKARALAAHGRIRLLTAWTRTRHSGHAELAEEFKEGIVGAHALRALALLLARILTFCRLIAITLFHGARATHHADIHHRRAIARSNVCKVGRTHRRQNRRACGLGDCRSRGHLGMGIAAHADQTRPRGTKCTNRTRSHQGHHQTTRSQQKCIHGKPFKKHRIGVVESQFAKPHLGQT